MLSRILLVVLGMALLLTQEKTRTEAKERQLAPGSLPRNVRARALNLQTIAIEWDEPEFPNGIIEGYKVLYTTKEELPIVLWNSQDVMDSNKMITISGLKPNTTYTFCILAFSAAGEGPLSPPVRVMTKLEEEVPIPDILEKETPSSAEETKKIDDKPSNSMPSKAKTLKQAQILYFQEAAKNMEAQKIAFQKISNLADVMSNYYSKQ